MLLNYRKIIGILIVSIFLFSTNAVALTCSYDEVIEKSNIVQKDSNIKNIDLIKSDEEDFDPLVDVEITVDIQKIRAFDKIDKYSDPDFYVMVIINDEEFISEIFYDKVVVEDAFQVTYNVPDDKEYVNITIQLWDWDILFDKKCDIGKNDNSNAFRRDIDIYYSIKTGHWFGDDEITLPHAWSVDYSGYGRANGCDDDSIYSQDLDCELFFDITQNDFDGDNIPYWTEVYYFNTDPEVDDTGSDDDNDDVPIEWEWKWGYSQRYNHSQHISEDFWVYDPNIADDHHNLDPDCDSIDNYEEYLVSEWGSDPYRKDVYVELDTMDAGPNGEPKSELPENAKELIYKAFNRQNVVFHLDDGDMGGSEIIPFDNVGEKSNSTEINQFYNDYFLHGDLNNWRRGVFHYGMVLYSTVSAAGFAFRPNAFQISTTGHEKLSAKPNFDRDLVYASAYMHELGHSLGLTWLGGHDRSSMAPWQIGWWFWRPYKSIMNYGYMYGILHDLVDYSDGSRGFNDFDDWSNIDYSYFEEGDF